MAEKKIVANFEIQAQSAKQELESLRAAEEGFIASGNTLATDLTQNFGEIEQVVGKMFAKLDDGGKVSQGQFDALVAKLATMKEAIANAGIPLDQLPEQFKKALATAETQVAALAGGMDAAKRRTEDLREEFGRASREAEELAESTRTAGERIADAAERAETAFENFSRTMLENPKEGLEQLPRVAAQVVRLRQEIERARATGGPVEESDIAALRRFEDRLEGAKNEAAEMKREIDRATAGLNDARQSWEGFDGIINNLAGRMGKVGVAAVGAWAALSEGVRIGNELNQVFGTDMSEWDKAVERFGAKMNLKITTTMDSMMAAADMFRAILSGDVDEIKQAYQIASDAGDAAQKAHQDIWTKYGADWDNARPKIDATTTAIDANSDAVKRNSELLKENADAHVKAFEEAKAKAVEAKTEKLKQQIDASLGLADATQQVADATDAATEATANAIGAADAQTAAIQSELDAVRALLEARGVDLEARKQIQQINLDAGASTDYLLMKERELAEQLTAQVTSWTATSTMASEQLDAKAQLAAIVEREKAAQDGLTTSVAGVRVEYENGVPVIKNTTDETGKLVGVLENGKVVYTNLDDAQRKATASGISFGENAKNVKTSAAEAAETMAGLRSEMTSLADAAERFDSTLARVNERLREMKTASAEAAGANEESRS